MRDSDSDFLHHQRSFQIDWLLRKFFADARTGSPDQQIQIHKISTSISYVYRILGQLPGYTAPCACGRAVRPWAIIPEIQSSACPCRTVMSNPRLSSRSLRPSSSAPVILVSSGALPWNGRPLDFDDPQTRRALIARRTSPRVCRACSFRHRHLPSPLLLHIIGVIWWAIVRGHLGLIHTAKNATIFAPMPANSRSYMPHGPLTPNTASSALSSEFLDCLRSHGPPACSSILCRAHNALLETLELERAKEKELAANLKLAVGGALTQERKDERAARGAAMGGGKVQSLR